MNATYWCYRFIGGCYERWTYQIASSLALYPGRTNQWLRSTVRPRSLSSALNILKCRPREKPHAHHPAEKNCSASVPRKTNNPHNSPPGSPVWSIKNQRTFVPCLINKEPQNLCPPVWSIKNQRTFIPCLIDKEPQNLCPPRLIDKEPQNLCPPCLIDKEPENLCPPRLIDKEPKNLCSPCLINKEPENLYPLFDR